MVNDLLEMDGDVIRYTTVNDQGQEQLKEVILGEFPVVHTLNFHGGGSYSKKIFELFLVDSDRI